MITNFQIFNLNNGTIYFDWGSDISDPTYYIYRNGIFIGNQSQNNYTINDLVDGEIFRFEVFDVSTDRPEVFYDNYFYFNFFVNDITNLREFLVEERINSETYVPTKSIFVKANNYFYSIRSNFYNDNDDVSVRITPVSINRKKGQPFEINKRIVTYPDSVNTESYIEDNKLYINIKPNLADNVTISGDVDAWNFGS